MKRNFVLILLTLSFVYNCGAALAADEDALDVFEEYAVRDAENFYTESFSIETPKNTALNDKLRFVCDLENPQFIVTLEPQKGKVEINQENGEFVYTPFQDQVGEDSFSFRITADDQESNISSCTITITEAEPEVSPSASPEPLGFVYEDMRNHWGNYSAVKMVESDILKGERVGSKYYFYPETTMKRIDVINYILAALGADLNDVNEDETHIFEDSASLPEYINKIAYVAHQLGIIDGEQRDDKVYLNPYANINRVEIITMIDRAMQSKTMSDVSLDDFADGGAVPDWAVQHVKNLLGYGIIQGFDDNTLQPFATLTKAQTVEMLYQMIKYNESAGVETMANRIKKGFYGKIIA